MKEAIMLRKFVVPVLALLAVPAIASAQFEAGDKELTLSGTASAPKSVEGSFIGVTGSVGYFLTKEAEISLRQQVSYLDNDTELPNVNKVAWGGLTHGAFDYHFDFGALQPFVGVYGGYEYPAGSTGYAAVGPEAGAKYFVNGTTFIFARVGYTYDLNDPDQSFFVGDLGVGFRF
jgi:hypothetical protein